MTSPNAKFFLVIAGAVTAAVLLGVVVLVPLLGLVRSNAESLRLLEERFEVMREQQRRVEEFRSFTKRYEGEFDRLRALLVNEETPIPFIEFLEGSADQSGLSMVITPGTVNKNKGDRHAALPFVLSLEGPYPGALVFLRRLEHAPFLLETEKVEMSEMTEAQRRRAGLGPGSVFLTVSLRAFTQDSANP